MSAHLVMASEYVRFDPKSLNSGDTAWLLASSALVLLMTPALAFFYGGMVRIKHVLAMLMQNFAAIAIVSITWVLVGFSWAFGGSGPLIGDFHYLGLQHIRDVVPALGSAQTVPTVAFVAFQLTFAIITPALITGGAADRWKFGAFVAFVSVWSVIVYAPVAHWVFDADGWAAKLGSEDFAGGTVVHINAGAAALAIALVLGKRKGWPRENMRGHNIPFVMLGAGLLWFGWFGFNAGSALSAGDLASFAFVNTNTATAAALIGWIVVEKLRYGKSTALGAASGAVTGLVAITPCAGFVSPMGSIVIGLLAGAMCAVAIGLKNKLGYDDALDVVGVHFVGGWVGTLAIGFFSTTGTNPAAHNGLFYGGNGSLLLHQFMVAAAVSVFSFVVSFALAKVIGLVFQNRVDEEHELAGLDISIHGETAYDFGPVGGVLAGHYAPAVAQKEGVGA